MPQRVLVGTSAGLHEPGAAERRHSPGGEVIAFAAETERWWAIVDGRTLTRRDGNGGWEEMAVVPAPPATCLAPSAAGLLVGLPPILGVAFG